MSFWSPADWRLFPSLSLPRCFFFFRRHWFGLQDTVVWSPYGDEGMGYKNFMCVESVAFDAVNLDGGASWSADLSLVPTAL